MVIWATFTPSGSPSSRKILIERGFIARGSDHQCRKRNSAAGRPKRSIVAQMVEATLREEAACGSYAAFIFEGATAHEGVMEEIFLNKNIDLEIIRQISRLDLRPPNKRHSALKLAPEPAKLACCQTISLPFSTIRNYGFPMVTMQDSSDGRI
jgi:hypothetical protein